jgi:hypothetical protein
MHGSSLAAAIASCSVARGTYLAMAGAVACIASLGLLPSATRDVAAGGAARARPGPHFTAAIGTSSALLSSLPLTSTPASPVRVGRSREVSDSGGSRTKARAHTGDQRSPKQNRSVSRSGRLPTQRPTLERVDARVTLPVASSQSAEPTSGRVDATPLPTDTRVPARHLRQHPHTHTKPAKPRPPRNTKHTAQPTSSTHRQH